MSDDVHERVRDHYGESARRMLDAMDRQAAPAMTGTEAKAGEAAATAAALQAYDEAKVVSIVASRPVPKDKRADRYGRAICCQYQCCHLIGRP